MPSPHFTLGTSPYKAPVSALTQAHGHQIVAVEGSQQSHAFLEITKENCKNVYGWSVLQGLYQRLQTVAQTPVWKSQPTHRSPRTFSQVQTQTFSFKFCINSPKAFLRSRFGLAPSPCFQEHRSSQRLCKLGLLAFRLMRKTSFLSSCGQKPWLFIRNPRSWLSPCSSVMVGFSKNGNE